MNQDVEILVRLLDEGVSVWRPVRARQLHGSVYKIIEQPYDSKTETWQFVHGDVVECEMMDFDDKRSLVACMLATSDT